MKTLLLATSNPGKVVELQDLLNHVCVIKGTSDFRLPVPDVIEDGMTYSENAEKKARAFYEVYKMPVLADDSGLEVDVLEGRPGVLSARYGGESISWPQRWEKLQNEIGGEDSSAQFRCVLCYFDGKNPPEFFEGVTRGRILTEASGDAGFGYDPIFMSEELEKSFGDASIEEKQSVSHRARAVLAFREWFQSL